MYKLYIICTIYKLFIIFFENVTIKWANNCCDVFVLKVVNDGLLLVTI